MGRVTEWLLVVISAGLVCAAAFSMTASPLEPLGILPLSFWLAALLILIAGSLSAVVLVDLKRAFLGVLGITFFATLFYGAALYSPAAVMSHYSTHLLNYAMVQSIPVLIITAVVSTLGALIGTAINASVREIDL